MPYSDQTFNAEIVSWVEANYPDRERTRILDVGPGSGKYANLLRDYTLDAIEVHEPYIERFGLSELYRDVIIDDIRNLLFAGDPYDLVILGDVLEHLTVDDATAVLRRIRASGAHVLIAVPYEYPQGPAEGNVHETHLQPDLTHDLMMERYPGLGCLVRNENYGIYYSKPAREDTTERTVHEVKMTVDVKSMAANVKLAIATPTHGGMVHADYLASLFRTQRAFYQLGISIDLLMVNGACVDRNRNMLVARFMDLGYTHLLFVDSDHGWQPENILRLIQMDKDVIGIAARKKTMELLWAFNSMPNGISEIDETGALEVWEIGTGFLLIKREVFQKMIDSYPSLRIMNQTKEESSPNLYALFQFYLDERGQYRSEDLTFCSRWRAIGGRIWADPHGDISHIGSHDYRGSIAGLVSTPLETAKALQQQYDLQEEAEK